MTIDDEKDLSEVALDDLKARQANFLLEADWRNNLPEVYRPIAERHGKDLFVVAWAIGAANEALNSINSMAQGNKTVRKATFFLASSMNTLATYAMVGGSMTMDKVAEVQRDIERASALVQAIPGKNEKGRIILPS